ncbi:hypothetical protein [Ciceribacter thiooxidans]|uniref:SnoaL-like protein n=1 Tax=Ciceribacter thiooxidans TaxID=1969821 RepID=A0ABV7HZZ1_9HYPH|nr:hypothetical protein [Ciceribacter thiooxidans]
MNLSERDALAAYGRMLNTNDVECVADLLVDDFRYCSQAVLTELVGKDEFLGYMQAKLSTIGKRADRPVAELATLPTMMDRPCLVLSHNDTGEPICTVLATVKGGRLSRVDLCLVPSPDMATRTGEVPK